MGDDDDEEEDDDEEQVRVGYVEKVPKWVVKGA